MFRLGIFSTGGFILEDEAHEGQEGGSSIASMGIFSMGTSVVAVAEYNL